MPRLKKDPYILNTISVITGAMIACDVNRKEMSKALNISEVTYSRKLHHANTCFTQDELKILCTKLRLTEMQKLSLI